MRKISLCLVLWMPLLINAQSSFSRYIVQLADKKGTPYTTANPAAYLSGEAIARRVRQHITPDSTDLPIPPAYLDSIASVPDVTILNRSRWLNQVLIRISDTAALSSIHSFAFVLKISPVAARFRSGLPDTGWNKPFSESIRTLTGSSSSAAAEGPVGISTPSGTGSAAGASGVNAPFRADGASGTGGNLVNYGNTFAQIHLHNGEYLHNLGFRGQGVVIAVIDDGFSGYLTNPVFDSARTGGQILGSWDFVNGKADVNSEDVHGMYCLSTIAANRPGSMVGSATNAKFWLFKTEDLSSEYPVEEQNWAAAAEFADSVGADIISTSLGYINFTDPSLDHSYALRNGHGTIITRAVNFAVSKGMIVTASAGNSGDESSDDKYVGCPADADSALTVGATDAKGQIADFSSWGPNSSGRIKPDVVSVGQGTVISDPRGNPTGANGTSFSNPNMAGLVACLWGAFPEFTNYEILDAVRKSADRYSAPDQRYGYGIPDFENAYRLLQAERGINVISSTGARWISAFPVPFHNNFVVVYKGQNDGNAYLALTDAAGRVIEKKSVVTLAGQWYSAWFDRSSLLPAGIYFIHFTDGRVQTTLKVIRH